MSEVVKAKRSVRAVCGGLPFVKTVVKEVIDKFPSCDKTFYGVLLEAEEPTLAFKTCLAWVVELEGQLFRQDKGPLVANLRDEAESELEAIFGHYELEGECFYSIKWKGADCPTWEPEGSVGGYSFQLLQYWTKDRMMVESSTKP